MKRLFTILLMSLTLSVFGQTDVIEDRLQEMLSRNEGEKIGVNIIFKSQMSSDELKTKTRNASDRKMQRSLVVDVLKKYSEKEQQEVLSLLKSEERSGRVSDIRCHWSINAINCKVTSDVIYELAQHPDVSVIAYEDNQYLFWDETSESVSAERGMTQNIIHVKADEVWSQGYTGKGVLVAILDTGANIEHVDIKDNLWDGGEEYPNHGYNTHSDSHEINDGFEHGTHCAGIICGNGSSGTQTGIAPDAKLMVIKVVDDAGSGGASTICAGIEFALEHGADVLNMSLGIPFSSTSSREMLRAACVNAMEAGVAAAVAVGNDGQLQISFPAPNNVRVPGGCPPPWIHPDQEVNAGGLSCSIAVGAVDFANNRAAFSSYGPFTWQETSYGDYHYNPGIGLIRPDVCAPGVSIVSASPKNNTGHVSMEGTSQAAPCVTGIMCLMLEKNPNLTPADLCRILETTATKLSDSKDNYTGSGCVNALAAVNAVEEGSGTETLPAPTGVEAVAESMSSILLSWEAVDKALSYNIYQDGEFLVSVDEMNYTVENLDADTRYCYNITAIANDVESEMSEEACAKTLPDGVSDHVSSLNIYPNPVNNILYIEAGTNIEEVSVYTIVGVMVYNVQCTNDNVQAIDISDYDSGVYFVKVKLDDGEILKKIIKQ